MNYECQKIQKTLKAIMKSKGATYKSIAKSLKVSPATIKRRLNSNDLTIQQMKDFSEVLSVSFYELIELSKQIKREPHLFTESQEKLLSSELWIMKLFRLIIAGHDFAQMKSSLNLSEKDLLTVAKKLEKVGLAKLLPGDRFVPLVYFPFKWQPDGLLARTYNNMIQLSIINRIEHDKKAAGLNKQFEFALSFDAYRSFCTDIEEVYTKYRCLSELHLSTQISMEQLISGIFFIDQFSIWDESQQKVLFRY